MFRPISILAFNRSIYIPNAVGIVVITVPIGLVSGV